MPKKYEIRNNKGDVTGTITPADQSSSSGPSSAASDVFFALILASIFGSMIAFFTLIIWGPLLLYAYEGITGKVVGDHSASIAIFVGVTFFVVFLYAGTSDMGVKRFLSGLAVITTVVAIALIVIWFLFLR